MPLKLPFDGPLTTLKISGSPSGSIPVKVMETGVSSEVVIPRSSAIGGRFTTVITAVSLPVAPSSSVTVTVTVKMPSLA